MPEDKEVSKFARKSKTINGCCTKLWQLSFRQLEGVTFAQALSQSLSLAHSARLPRSRSCSPFLPPSLPLPRPLPLTLPLHLPHSRSNLPSHLPLPSLPLTLPLASHRGDTYKDTHTCHAITWTNGNSRGLPRGEGLGFDQESPLFLVADLYLS